MNKDMQTSTRPDIDLLDVLKQRVLEGHPIVVTGTMDEPMAKMHVAIANDLRESTGKPVTVVHIPK